MVLSAAAPGYIHVYFHNINCLANHSQTSYGKKKVQVGKDQEKAQSEKKIPTPKTEVGKTKLTARYLYYENIS